MKNVHCGTLSVEGPVDFTKDAVSLKGSPYSVKEVKDMASSVAQLQQKWTAWNAHDLPNMNAEFAPQLWEFMSRLKPGNTQVLHPSTSHVFYQHC